jgi:hypothetical protein
MDKRLGAIRITITACMLAALTSAGSAAATLLDRGPFLVYDDVLEITWTRLADLPGSSGLTSAGARTWAASLVYAGHDDWRLPYASVSSGEVAGGEVVPCERFSEFACTDNEMGYMFYYNLGGHLRDDKTGSQTALGGEQLTRIQRAYWSGSEYPALGSWFFLFDYGYQAFSDFTGNGFSAWAVRSGDSTYYVPEPSAVFLIGFGLAALAWMKHGRRDVGRISASK